MTLKINQVEGSLVSVEGEEGVFIGVCTCGNTLTYPDEYIDGVMCHACYIYDKDPYVAICDYCNFVDDNFFLIPDEDGEDEVVCLECVREHEDYAFEHKLSLEEKRFKLLEV